MAFGSGFHRDDRRRRVHSDAAAESPPKRRRLRRGRSRNEKSRNYGKAEFLDRQPRWIDLIPTRPRALLGLAVLGGGIVAGLIQLHLSLPSLTAITGELPLASLELAGRGALGGWFASMFLAVAAVVAVLVYTIRRHKRDDYRGHYRIWLWAAVAWLLLSAEVATGLRHDFARIVTTLSGTPLFGDGAVWWIIPYGFLVGGIGTRLLVDMRHGRLSAGVFVLAAAAFGAAIAARLTGEPADDPIRHVLIRQGGMLAGSLLLLLSMLFHARYVLLDAQGRLSDDSEEEDQEEASDGPSDTGDEEAESQERGVTVHPPHAVARPKLTLGGGIGGSKSAPQAMSANSSSGKGASGAGSSSSSALSGGISPVNRKLTKQEKRALRERLAKMRAERDKK